MFAENAAERSDEGSETCSGLTSSYDAYNFYCVIGRATVLG
jgi:hypothetical protein